jgi:hypothetical protein
MSRLWQVRVISWLSLYNLILHSFSEFLVTWLSSLRPIPLLFILLPPPLLTTYFITHYLLLCLHPQTPVFRSRGSNVTAAVLASEQYKFSEVIFPLSAPLIQRMLSDICIIYFPYFLLNSVTYELPMNLLKSKITATHRKSLVINSMLYLT